MEIEIATAAFILFILTLLASVDMAFSQLSDVSLRKLFSEAEENKKNRAVEFFREVFENRPRFRFALSSAIQVLLIVFSVLVVILVHRFFKTPREMLIYSLLIGLSFSVVFRQVFPRLITMSNPEGRLFFLLALIRPIYAFLQFIADLIEPSFRRLRNAKNDLAIVPENSNDKSEDNTDDIQALIEIGKAEGIIEEKERALIETMVEFGGTSVDEVMTPRTEIRGLQLDATITMARDMMIEEKFSRLPVYRENIDNIEGVIYIRDILNAWAKGKENQSIKSHLRSAYFVPETKSVAELLKSMQKNHVQLSIVIDEYGGVAGLVTVEDILEEIVGEIEDEDLDKKIVKITKGDEGYFDVLASTEIGEIEQLFNIEIDDDDFTTIAGLVTTEIGYVPKIKEKLHLSGLDVEILKADDKKIHLLRLRKSSDKEYSTTNKA